MWGPHTKLPSMWQGTVIINIWTFENAKKVISTEIIQYTKKEWK